MFAGIHFNQAKMSLNDEHEHYVDVTILIKTELSSTNPFSMIRKETPKKYKILHKDLERDRVLPRNELYSHISMPNLDHSMSKPDFNEFMHYIH